MLYETVKKPKKIKDSFLDSAVDFGCNYLKLNVDLLTIEFQNIKNGVCGYCEYYSSEEVTVIINKRLSIEEMIKTLFHELVHVKQYRSGRLKSSNIWKGVVYECNYAETPWEIEAYELEEKMMRKFYGVNY